MKTKAPFLPPDLPPTLDYREFLRELLMARGKLGELNGALGSIKNPQLISAPLVTKEAVYSSQIEGTQANLEDVYRLEATDPDTQKTEIERDVKEIGNYRDAIKVALADLDKIPVSSRLIRRMHEVLLDSVRGSNKDRGRFRKIQVFIGKPGDTIGTASFVPPEATEIPRLIADWEKYVHSDQEVDPLVMAGVAHYQFEAIHPFLDGNGRIGRILIPLILYERGLIRYPSLFVSQYFEENRSEYYERLKRVSTKSDWSGWLRFFLQGILETSKRASLNINALLGLYEEILPISLAVSAKYGLSLQEMLFDSPFISFMKVKRVQPAMSPQTIYNLLNRYVELGVLVETTGQKRSKVYKFPKLIHAIA